MTTQIFTALAFVLKGAMMDRFVYRWAVAVSPLDLPKSHWLSMHPDKPQAKLDAS